MCSKRDFKVLLQNTVTVRRVPSWRLPCINPMSVGSVDYMHYRIVEYEDDLFKVALEITGGGAGENTHLILDRFFFNKKPNILDANDWYVYHGVKDEWDMIYVPPAQWRIMVEDIMSIKDRVIPPEVEKPPISMAMSYVITVRLLIDFIDEMSRIVRLPMHIVHAKDRLKQVYEREQNSR